MLRLHVYPAFGDRPLSAIRPSHIEAWSRGLMDTLAPATVRGLHRYLSGVLAAAVRDRMLPSNPMEGVAQPKRKARRAVVPLSVEEVLRLADAVPDHWRAAVVLAAGTGMRQGEVFGLTVDRIDW